MAHCFHQRKAARYFLVVLGALLPRTEFWIPSASFLSSGESREDSSCQINNFIYNTCNFLCWDAVFVQYGSQCYSILWSGTETVPWDKSRLNPNQVNLWLGSHWDFSMFTTKPACCSIVWTVLLACIAALRLEVATIPLLRWQQFHY